MYGHAKLTEIKDFELENYKLFFVDIYSCDFETRKFGTNKIYQLTFEVHKNQEVGKEEVEYWGWQNNDGEVIMMFPSHTLFEENFSDSIEKHNRGKRIKLELTNFTNHYNNESL